jgi:hypothetical protein
LGKFKGVSKQIGSSMKSVGEVMAIGRNFEEAIQKGLRMIGQGMHGFVENKELEITDREEIEQELSNPTDTRIFVIAMALEHNFTIDEIHELTKIDRWFLYKLKNLTDLKNQIGTLCSGGRPAPLMAQKSETVWLFRFPDCEEPGEKYRQRHCQPTVFMCANTESSMESFRW